MTADRDPSSLVGTTAADRDGNVLGTVSAVWLDDATGRPSWVGLTAGSHADPGTDGPLTLAPLAGAQPTGDRLQLDVTGAQTREAPRRAGSERLTPEDELRLREHYAGAATVTPRPDDAAMTRSEERLSVSTETLPWSRAVLRVETVTEEVMVPVTITRQIARVEHLPLEPTATGSAVPGPDGQAGEWVVLWGERPVVTVERTPVERVRLRTGWVTREDTVTAELAHEEITLDAPGVDRQ